MQHTDSHPLTEPNHPTEHAHARVIVRGTALPELVRLYESEVMLVTAPLPPSAAALAHAEALAAAGPRSSSAEVAILDGGPAADALEPFALPGERGAREWTAYLEEITSLFAELLGARVVGVRQVVADGPHCPRLHVDRVTARGVLNVLGACTEWLDSADVDRSRLGHAGGPDDTTSGLVQRWEGLQRAAHGEVAVFKGTAWPHASERAIVHRSPPADGRWRVVLTLDWIE